MNTITNIDSSVNSSKEKDVSYESIIKAIEVAQEAWKKWEWDQPVATCCCDVDEGPIVGSGEYEDWSDRLDFLLEQGHAHFCASEIVTAEQGFARVIRREAARAAQFGDEAIKAIRLGRMTAAIGFISEARSIELDHGGDITWGPVLQLLLSLAKKVAA